MNGPTIRRLVNGRTRPTWKLPMLRFLWSIISSIIGYCLEEALDTRIRSTCATEDRCPRDQHVSARFDSLRRSFSINSSVNLNVACAVSLVQLSSDLSNLFQRLFDKTLAAKAWIHRHYQDQIQILQNLFQHHCGCRRVEARACLFAQSLYQLNRAVEVRRGLLMNDDMVCARVYECFNIQIRLLDH